MFLAMMSLQKSVCRTQLKIVSGHDPRGYTFKWIPQADPTKLLIVFMAKNSQRESTWQLRIGTNVLLPGRCLDRIAIPEPEVVVRR
jgi:hypothetical protein